eukprot:3945479-Amphidinium_carterae.2
MQDRVTYAYYVTCWCLTWGLRFSSNLRAARNRCPGRARARYLGNRHLKATTKERKLQSQV